MGYEPGKIDGIYGKNTHDAVKRFQQHYDRYLAVDGDYGPETKSRLCQVLEVVRFSTEPYTYSIPNPPDALVQPEALACREGLCAGLRN